MPKRKTRKARPSSRKSQPVRRTKPAPSFPAGVTPVRRKTERTIRTAEFYIQALQGAHDSDGALIPGLRSIAKGFSAADGYNLKNIDSWTGAQKARVTRYYKELILLTAQPRMIYRPRNKKRLHQAQEISGQSKGYQFKVAFVPHTPKKGAKVKARVTVKDGVLSIREEYYQRDEIPLRRRPMAKNATAEINHSINTHAPRAMMFTVKAGPNEIPGLKARRAVTEFVQQLMNKYDGVKTLPKGSGNRGDHPRHHKWDKWLKSLIAYTFDKPGEKAVKQVSTDFEQQRAELRRRRRNLRERNKRHGAVKK